MLSFDYGLPTAIIIALIAWAWFLLCSICRLKINKAAIAALFLSIFLLHGFYIASSTAARNLLTAAFSS